MTTVEGSVQPGSWPLQDADRCGEARTAFGPVRWAAVGSAHAPVVLLVAATDDLWGWPPGLVDALVAEGLQVVAVSAPPEAADDAVAVADAMAAALAAVGADRAHVVGASQGGVVAQAMAAAHPALVASLTLLMTRRPTLAPVVLPTEMLAVLAPPRGGRPVAERAIDASAALRRQPGPVAGLAAHLERAVAAGLDPVTGLLCFAAGEDASVPPPVTGIPTLVMHGDEDPLLPVEAARRLADALGGELVVVPGGHDLPWGHEAEIAQWIGARVERRPRRRVSLVGVVGVLSALVVVAVIAASSIDVPYYGISPGSARQTNDLVEVPEGRRFAPAGQLLFVTVGVGRLKALGWLVAKLDSDVAIVPERDLLGTTSRDDFRDQASQEMADAKQAAVIVALNRICERVVETGTGARVEQLVDGSPAAQAGFTRGDVVTAVGGTPVTTANEALAILRTRPPGVLLEFTTIGPTEGAQPRTMTATLGARPDDPARAFLGVTLRTRQQQYELPFEVTIDSGRVGGPSAGLEFALSVVDQLTPGELTAGRKVAVTGTIELDGTVGAVGGVPQKAVTVRESGAKLFLVPMGQVEEARSKAGDGVEVVGVATLDEAIQALAAKGGDISGIPDSCGGP